MPDGGNLPILASPTGALLTVARHPFAPSRDRTVEYMPEGMTIQEMIDSAGFDPVMQAYLRVTIDGQPIFARYWRSVTPKAGRHVVIQLVPGKGGDSGKNPLKTVLTIAVIAAAFFLGPGLGAALGISPTAGVATFGIAEGAMQAAVGGFLITVVGTLAINALIPPPKPSMATLGSPAGLSRTSPTLSITGTRNQANKWGVVPKNFGRNRIYPCYAAQPFTENVGDDQFLTCLFDFGDGPNQLSQLRIGEVPLHQFEDVEVEIREGWDDDEPLSLYRNSIPFQDGYSLKLTESGGRQVLETKDNADEIGIDFGFNGLVEYDQSGNPQSKSVSLKVEYRAAGSAGAWTAVDGHWQQTVAYSDVTQTAAPVGEAYTAFITDQVIVGPVTTKITIPETHDGATIYGMKFRAYARPEGATTWRKQYEDRDWLRPGDIASITLASVNDKRLEVKIELAAYALDADSAAWDGLNDGMTNAVPEVGSWTYRSYESIGGGTVTFTAASEQAVRRSITIRPPTKGRYEIGFTRLTADSTSAQVRDECFVSAIRTITFTAPINVTNHTLVALRIRATDQLNGVVDSFNAIAQAVLPVWDGASWTDQPTRSPAWAYAAVLQGRANQNAVADSRVDLAALLDWAQACAAPAPQTALPGGVQPSENEPTWAFDANIDYDTTVKALLDDIAAAGRAARSSVDGKFSVVRDVAQSVPVQHLSPRNSWGFKGSKKFGAEVHAFKAAYRNPDKNWDQDHVIVYADGYNADGSNGMTAASKFESMDMFGCTSAAQAWRDCRYHMAVSKLRPETFEHYCDVEHIVCTKGDLVRVSHDVPRWGLGYGRVKTVTLNGSNEAVSVDIDDVAPMEAGKSYAIRFRLDDGSSVYSTVQTVVGEQKTLTFTTPLAAADVPAAGDTYMFGQAGLESVELIVQNIEPGRDFTAKLRLVDAAPAVHQADQGVIPEYSTQSTMDPTNTAPAAVIDVSMTEVAVGRVNQYDLSLEISWRLPVGYYASAYEIYRKLSGSWKAVDTVAKSRYTVTGLRKGDYVELAIVGVAPSGRKLSIADSTQVYHAVTGLKPSDVGDFRGNLKGDQFHLSWSTVSAVKPSYYRIKFSPETTAVSWANSVTLIEKVSYPISTVSVPARTGTYLIKGYSEDGSLESDGEAIVITTAPGMSSLNVEDVMTEDPAFSGMHSGTVVDAGRLRLKSADTMASIPRMSDVPNMSYGINGMPSQGTYEFAQVLDLGAVYDARITATLQVFGQNLANRMADIVRMADVTRMSGANPSSYDVEIQISMTEDDPNVSPTWSDWHAFVVADYHFRAVRFRAVLKTSVPAVTPVVPALSVTIDMQDELQVIDGVLTDAVADPTGTAVVLPFEFKGGVTQPNITMNDGQAGDTWTVTNVTVSGFTILFANGGSPVSRSFNAWIKGYGRKAA